MKLIYENPKIYQLDIPLPNNPLRNLNSYVIKDKDEALIIDTGFCNEVCRDALFSELEQLDLNWDKTNLFITHLHSDHSGLAKILMENKSGDIYMSEIDHKHLNNYLDIGYFAIYDPIFMREGFTQADIDWLHGKNPSSKYKSEEPFEAVHVNDGDIIKVGDYDFQVVETSGHTIGHSCLYNAEEKLFFAGDHILFNISPNITFWVELKDALSNYLDSLVKVRNIDIKTIFVSHRQNDGDIYQRINDLIQHHLQRLIDTLKAIEISKNSNGNEIASHLQWSMRGKTWADFPLTQKWFALGETIAHIDYLRHRGFVIKTETETENIYSLAKPLETGIEELKEIWKQYN